MHVDTELLRRRLVAASIRKHADHDQSSHGNWAYGQLNVWTDPKGWEGDRRTGMDDLWDAMGVPPESDNTRFGSDADGRPIIEHGAKNRFSNWEVERTEPIKHLFRVISEQDYQRIQSQGYIDTDGNMNLDAAEGLVTSARSTGSFYAPQSGHARIIRIDYNPDDGWKVDIDEYVKTQQRVPAERISLVSPIIEARIEVERRGDRDPAIFGTRVGWQGTNRYLLSPDDTPAPDLPFYLTPGDLRRAGIETGAVDIDENDQLITKHASHDQSTHGNRDGSGDDDYRIQHQPGLYGAPGHDLNMVAPELYEHPEWYFSLREPMNRESFKVLQRIRNNPDARLTIFRAVPRGVPSINPDDWVTTSRLAAELHGEGGLGGAEFDILSMEVSAKELIWPGDSLVEFGWSPSNPFATGFAGTLEELDDHLAGLAKHASHDQSTHGSWARKSYHLTNDPNFSPDPSMRGDSNYIGIHYSDAPGLYVTDNPEYWLNGFGDDGYWRPFVAEIGIRSDSKYHSMTPAAGREEFIPAEAFGDIEVLRVLPLDEYAREEYGEAGWVEEALGDSEYVGRHGYNAPSELKEYRSPRDARSFTDDEREAELSRFARFLSGSKGWDDDTIEQSLGVKIAKHYGPGPHDSGSDQSVHGDGDGSGDDDTGGSLYDEYFAFTVTSGDDSYTSVVDKVSDYEDHIQIVGYILDDYGNEVGEFDRWLNSDGTVKNAVFRMSPDHQGKGIGLQFARRWEQNLKAAGFTDITLSATNVGRYAWAVEGYDWEGQIPGGDVMDHLMSFPENRGEEFTFNGSEWGETRTMDIPEDSPAWDELDVLIADYEQGDYIAPLDIAKLGARYPGPSGWHLGKFIMLSGPEWTGEKEL